MKLISWLILPALAAGCAVVDRSGQGPRVGARAAIVWDVDRGVAVYEKNADKHLPVASTQKLLTAIESIRAGQLEKQVEITAFDAAQPPSRLGLEPGSRHRKIDLLGAMLVTSANDAASALSHADGDRASFIAGMNRHAARLGARNSHFTNPHGLDENGQFSTARDMALIACAAMRDPLVRRFAATRTVLLERSGGDWMLAENTNELLWDRGECFDGLKSGFTLQGGKCLVASARSHESRILIVLLGGTPEDVFPDARRLLRWHEKRFPDGPG